MTCVIAQRDANNIHMAADRAISNPTGLANGGGRKLVKLPSGLLVGFAGSLSTQNVMAASQELADCDLSDDISVTKLHSKLAGAGGFQLPGAPVTHFWAEMLLAMRDQVVYMGSAGGWHRVPEPVKALGDGCKVALGSWHERDDLQPHERLKRAIEIAGLLMPGIVSQDCDYDHT